ncbi:nucleoside deaminase, partial [Desulfamplus magnetovallimortis]|uniref:nucleoside deaminase n=1 Tax=Desulfamplus magnetovallimortis TaxID=1246637 RepID=UPI0009BA1515
MEGTCSIASKDEINMRFALSEALMAFDRGDFPVGCVIVESGKVVATGSREGTAYTTNANEVDHAEIRALKSFYSLDYMVKPEDCTIYVTMEPCLMCYGAILLSGIGRIVYAYEDVMGGGTSCDLDSLPLLYKKNRPVLVHNVLREESPLLFARF